MRKSNRFLWMLSVAVMGGSLALVHTQQTDAERAMPPLSHQARQYYKEHPQEFQRFVESLPPVSHEIVPGRTLAPGEEPVPGTWTSLTNPSTINMSNPLLLTDGTVIAHRSCTPNWYKFTPSNTGSYINGTWAPIASTVAGYGPRFFGSAVLPDGRVVIDGGEYNGSNGSNCSAVWGTQGAIYDPVANAWTVINPPAGWVRTGDATGIVLSNGTYMQTSCCDNPPKAALLNPSTLTWTATGNGKFDVYDEESIALLHDDSLLTVDAYVFTNTCGTNSERYTNATGAWATAGSTIIQQSDCTGEFTYEVGPLVQRYDGTAVHFSGRTSGVPQTAIYNVPTHTWAAGPAHPSLAGVPYTMADAPAAVLPNGNVLVAMSPSNWTASNHFPRPTHYWELNTDNTWTQAPDKVDAASFNSYEGNFILLPTGQVMATSIDGPTVQIYTPTGTFQDAWRPVISSVPTTLSPGQAFTLSGTQLNGLTQGAYYGDDTNADTNFPLVRMTNNATGHVFYARTFNHSTRTIAPGAASSTSFQVPAGIENGAATLVVVANGIPSLPVNVTVAVAPASSDDLVVDFGVYGVWILFDGNTSAWVRLHAASAKNIVTGDLDGNGIGEVIVDFGSAGIWVWANNSSWFQLHQSTATRMATGDLDGNGKADILVEFQGFGIWVWSNNATWYQLHPSGSNNIVVADLDGNGKKEAIIDFPGAGLWVRSNSTSWYQLHQFNSRLMTAGDFDGNGKADLIVDFAGYGLWGYMNSSSWSQVHQFDAAHMAAGDIDGGGLSDLIVDFGSQFGIWKLLNGTAWSQINTVTSSNLITGDLDGNGRADVISNFGTAGLWEYVNNAYWIQLHTAITGPFAVARLNAP